MKAKETPFFELFNQNVQYLVPRWQRRYVWRETEIDRLIKDMLAIADAENQARPHYGGTMITVQERSGVMKVHRVVDGQQRLTTVSILLACIAETLDANGTGVELTPEEIRDDLLTNPKKQEDRRRKLRLQDGDEEEYRRIIERDSPGSGDGHVAGAWRIVTKRVDSENVQSLIKGLHRLRVITIGLEDRDDAQQIFESLNATGKPLTEGEKVKNWLLMGLSEEVQNDLHDEHWLAIESDLDARHDSERIDVFLRDVMRWWTGKMVAENRTYDEFRRWAIREGRDSPERRPELCAELASLAALYGQMTGTAATQPSRGVKRELDHLRAMGIDAHRPFTLRLLWNAQQARESGQDPTRLVHILGSVSSWITRLWLAGHSFTGLGKAFVELASGTGPTDESDRAGFWERRIASVPERIAVPADSAVTDGIRLTSKYGGKDTRATRAVLCAITFRETWGEVECGKLTVEHIMPQTLNEAWRNDLGDRVEEIHGRHLHRLGNLTLCGGRWGSALSNHSFEHKKELYRKSAVAMTRRLAELPKWDEEAIRRRAGELARTALKLWPWTGGL
ncbi:MAG: DUF262 domain-containing HNH endonuclease family protein [Gemmatimonadota bacterium]|nr:DUF262 domain-containing HNH endonuclease family protein [Gemmatimonadota bacterium]